jgi:tetratricopeptide (TPR) repeat protein
MLAKYLRCKNGESALQKVPGRMNKAFLFLLFLSVSSWMLRGETIPGLGTATFPTSTRSAAAQGDFIRGLLLLHLFEYQDAAKAFVAAEKVDPDFAMAYWGEAMTFNHAVWNKVAVSAGQAALAKFGATPEARARRIADPRERAYMQAVEILYSGKGSKRERDAQYATAMEQLSEAYAKDDEAKLFYALALLGKSEGVRDVPTYLKAAEIAKAVFMRNPAHPGAAHYWIHGMDDPQHAAGALEAARALSKIAPDAAHAQHMCSHIFLALGMWDDVVQANVAATSVVNRQAAAAGKPPRRCGHYNYWLEYGYLEQGRIAEAREVVAACRAEAAEPGMAVRAVGTVDPDDASVGSFAVMRSRYIVDTGRWKGEVAGWNVDLGSALMPEFNYAFGTGFAAAQFADLPEARKSLATFGRLLPQLPALFDQAGIPADDPSRRVPEIQKAQIEAVILSSEGHSDQAIATMQQAAATGKDLPYAFGPPSPQKPSDELLGELLLKANKAPQAREAFEASLERAPRRTQSLLGLARAESAIGDKRAAANSYSELLRIWKNAEPGYAPREEARHYVSIPSHSVN